MNRPARRRLLLLGLLLLGLLVGWLLWRNRPGAPPTASPTASPAPTLAPEPFQFAWPPGTVYGYRIRQETSGLFLPLAGPGAAATPIRATLSFEGRIALHSYGQVAADWLLGVQLARVDRLEWRILDQPVLPDGPVALLGHEVPVLVSAAGEYLALYVAADVPAQLRNLLRQLLSGLQVVVVAGRRSWETQEVNPLGEVAVAYTLGEEQPFSLELERRPRAYLRLTAGPAVRGAIPTVEGSFAATLARAGHLRQVMGQEQVSARLADGVEVLASRTHLRAELVSLTRTTGGLSAAERLAGLTEEGFGATSVSPDLQTRLLEQRADGLTQAEFEQGFQLQLTARLPGGNRWLWRAIAYLRLHPEQCRALAPRFLDPQADPAARSLVLDLLAAAGTEPAQAVMRELLDSPAARNSENRVLLLQRLSLLAAPTAATAEFLRGRVASGSGELALAAAHSLGSVASKLPGTAVATEALTLLRTRLDQAPDPGTRAAWLGALGNGGQPEDVARLTAHAGDASPDVRAAVAGALRLLPTPEAQATLLTLAADADPWVQRRALQALDSHGPGPSVLDRLEELIRAGQLHQASQSELLNLLDHTGSPGEATRRIIEALLEQGIPDRQLRRRAQELAHRR